MRNHIFALENPCEIRHIPPEFAALFRQARAAKRQVQVLKTVGAAPLTSLNP